MDTHTHTHAKPHVYTNGAEINISVHTNTLRTVIIRGGEFLKILDLGGQMGAVENVEIVPKVLRTKPNYQNDLIFT